MRHVLVAIMATFALLVGTASPASAGEALTRSETRLVVKYLLRNYIAPAVTDTGQDPSVISAWGCKTLTRNTGTCKGRVTTGSVTCTGTFKVRKSQSRKVRYFAWPLQMECAS
jgi:hypothetical protein